MTGRRWISLQRPHHAVGIFFCHLLSQGGIFGFKFFDPLFLLFGLLTPILSAVGHVLDAISHTLGITPQLFILLFPIVPATLQKPDLNPTWGRVLFLLAILADRVHAKLQ